MLTMQTIYLWNMIQSSFLYSLLSLQHEVKSLGLWNFYLTTETEVGRQYGAGLNYVEYAYIAELLGWSLHAPEVYLIKMFNSRIHGQHNYGVVQGPVTSKKHNQCVCMYIFRYLIAILHKMAIWQNMQADHKLRSGFYLYLKEENHHALR